MNRFGEQVVAGFQDVPEPPPFSSMQSAATLAAHIFCVVSSRPPNFPSRLIEKSKLIDLGRLRRRETRTRAGRSHSLKDISHCKNELFWVRFANLD
jgi:hypothetical protein